MADQSVFKQGLESAKTNGTQLFLCEGIPADYTAASAASGGNNVSGAGRTMVAGDLTYVVNATNNGFDVVIAAANNIATVAITTTGGALKWAWCDPTNSVLIQVFDAGSSEILTAGNPIHLPTPLQLGLGAAGGHENVHKSGLDYLIANGSICYVCHTQPTTYTEAATTFNLSGAGRSLAPTDYAYAANGAGWDVVIPAATAAATATADNAAPDLWYAIVNPALSELLWVFNETSDQAIVNGRDLDYGALTAGYAG